MTHRMISVPRSLARRASPTGVPVKKEHVLTWLALRDIVMALIECPQV